jgi:signal transduction histidine kinase
MSGQLVLDWPALALSLFDAFLLCWLGFTVILEADRRALGVWLSADGLFLGAAFFIAHTAILRNGWQWNNPMLDFWWRAGWWPLILSPFAWYCVILWYSGYWDDPASDLHRRQSAWFGFVLVATVGLLGWMVLANPLPDLSGQTFNHTGFLGLAILFPVYILACILLALDAILRPGPTARLLGNEARRQARPWLTASTLVLLVVCLLVAFALVWGILTFVPGYARGPATMGAFLPLTGLDVLVEILITAAILLIGQAAMVYEVFSSIPLPRSGLRKRWRFAIWSGSIFALLLSAVLTYFARPELAYLVFIPFLTGAMTWQNRQSAREQELQADQMRSLAQPRQTYERIFIDPQKASDTPDMLEEFDLICTSLLRTEKAVLKPLGVLSNFLPTFIFFPEKSFPLPDVPNEPETSGENFRLHPLDPSISSGFRWAIPLVSSRGLDGWLYIGERLEGGFYTLEEIEIARAALERWMDNQASAEIARRLVDLQHQRLSETRLLDQKARRILHDDILPLLHTAILAEPRGSASDQITAAHQQISHLLSDAPPPAPAEIASSGLFTVLEKLARNEADLLHANLTFNVDEKARGAAVALPVEAAETVYYAVRECLRNIEKHTQPELSGELEIRFISLVDGVLKISIENNGKNKETEETSSNSNGQGIRLHNAMLAVFGGGMRLEKLENGNMRATINLPVKLY